MAMLPEKTPNRPLRCPPFSGGRLYYGWVQVWVLSFTELVSWGILYYAYSVMIVPMGDDLGWSRVQMTAAFSVGGLISGVCGIPVGRWVDRHGARALMTAGSIAGTGLVLAWATVQTLPVFFLIWAGIGLTMSAVLYEPAFVVVATWFRRDRNRALAILTFTGGLASVVFLPLTTWLVEGFGWREALVVLALILAVTTIVPHALFIRHTPAALGLAPDGAAPVEEPPETPQSNGPEPPASHQGDITLGGALRMRPFWWMASSFAMIWGCTIAVQIHLIPYLQDQGFSPAFAATAAGAIGLLKLPGRVIFAPLADRFGHRVVALAIFLLHAVAIGVLATADSRIGIFAFVGLFSAGNGALTLMRASLVADVFGLRAYGGISGTIAFVIQAAIAAGPLVVSLLVVAWGGYTPVFWALAAVVGLSALGIARVGGAAPDSRAAYSPI
ncbi:MAG: MFS transporter [Chloroflexia bacterium]|nr:MFS transporter [Chloroflexia bacterium]